MRETVSVRVEGFRELDKALGELESKALAKGVLRRVLLKAGKPVADHANSIAPDDPRTPDPDLNTSFFVGTKLNKRQKKEARNDTKSFQEVYVGSNDVAAIQQEFGNVNHGPKPSLRPAWDAKKFQALDIIKRDLGSEIEKTAARAAKRKAAKALKLANG